jgi:glycosyltransferase involved in cell wall biosynthesis
MKFFMGVVVFCRDPRTKEVLQNNTSAEVNILHGVLNESKVREAYEHGNSESKSNSDKVEIVFVGRLTDLKNPEAAIINLSKLPSRFQLIVVGDGPKMEDLEVEIENLNVEDRVKLKGELSHEDTLKEMSAADGLILTSKAEAYPTVVFEGLSLTQNVFATPVGILPSLDEERLHLGPADELHKLIKDIGSADDCGLHEDILGKYSMDKYAEEILDAFIQRI